MGIQIRKIHKIAENKNPVSVAYYLQGNKKAGKETLIKRQEGKYFCLECEATEASLITGGIQNVTSIWKTACHFLTKLKSYFMMQLLC